MPARLEDTPQRAREVGPRGDEQREVEEPCRPGRPRGRVGIRDELDERAVPRAEQHGPVARLERTEPDRPLVEVPQEADIPCSEPDRAEPSLGRQLSHRPRSPGRERTS